MRAHSFIVFACLLSCTEGTIVEQVNADMSAPVSVNVDAGRALAEGPRDAAQDADVMQPPDMMAVDTAPDVERDAGIDMALDAAPDMARDDGPLKAFPRAYGGGAEATGGRGGVLIIVNNEDPAAPLVHYPATNTTPERYEGGLYDALQLERPAYITFERAMHIRLGVGGTATAFSGYGIPDVSDKTLFGQSAPRGGVTITGGTFRFDNVSRPAGNVIFRYLRSRPVLNRDGVVSIEDDSHTWGLLIMGGEDIIVDHCSFSFAQDKGLGGAIRAADQFMRDMTFSSNLIADSHTGAYVEINPGREGEPEKYVDRISWMGNAVVGINRTPNLAFDGYAEHINNVIYGDNYKSTTIYHDLRLNHISNVYVRPGGSRSGFNRIFEYDESTPRIYSAGNRWEGLLEGLAGEDNQAIWKDGNDYEGSPREMFFVSEPFEGGITHAYPVQSAADAYALVVTRGDVGAGAYLDDEGRPQRYHDPYDTAQIEMMRRGESPEPHRVENWVLPELPQSVRPTSYDTDKDGLADAWELRVFGDLSESYDGDHDGDGYTHIEEFMNQVDWVD